MPRVANLGDGVSQGTPSVGQEYNLEVIVESVDVWPRVSQLTGM